jgi:hypothetical protein
MYVYAHVCIYPAHEVLASHIYDRICMYCKYMYVYARICMHCMYLYVCTYMSVLYIYGSICICIYMHVCICTSCTYMPVYVGISQRHVFRYMQILTYTDNTYKYVHTYRICTMCKCTFLFVLLSEYDTICDPLLEIRTNTYNMVHWWDHVLVMNLKDITDCCCKYTEFWAVLFIWKENSKHRTLQSEQFCI